MAIAETDTAGPNRKGRKYQQVLDGAQTVFLSTGFGRATVDEIAQVAGVSKATIYSYFPDKNLLFKEVFSAAFERMFGETQQAVNLEDPARIGLRTIAEHILRAMLSEFARDLFRICVSEVRHFPELGPAYYAAGPNLVRRRLSDYLQHVSGRGDLTIEDHDMAADHFYELCKTRLWARANLGIQTEFSDAEISRVCDFAVDIFMTYYGSSEG